VKVAGNIETTPPPTEKEIAALRSLDPDKIYLR
jgi:hypothetical protein